MLVRRLVSGVRSSWEASRTSWRWLSREASRAASRRLKARRRRPSSSGPPGSSRWDTSVVRASSSTESVRLVERAQHGAADAEAEQDGEGHTADEDDQPQGHGQAVESLVDAGQGGGELQRRRRRA